MIDLEVDMIHRSRQVAILSDGQEIAVTHWWNEDGTNADDPTEAVSCTCGPDFDGMWYAVNLRSFTGRVM